MTLRRYRFLHPLLWGAVLVLALASGTAAAQKQRLADVPGYVDSSAFVALAGGEENVRVEVSIHRSLIKLFCAALEEELGEAICGLESINAVIVAVNGRDVQAKANKIIVEKERQLLDRGWERLAKVVDEDAIIRVLVLNDETSISGLVVMVLNRDEDELVFANVAGRLDLEALQKLGNKMNIPGLKDLEGYR